MCEEEIVITNTDGVFYIKGGHHQDFAVIIKADDDSEWIVYAKTETEKKANEKAATLHTMFGYTRPVYVVRTNTHVSTDFLVE